MGQGRCGWADAGAEERMGSLLEGCDSISGCLGDEIINLSPTSFMICMNLCRLVEG
jgi:hypothetical protein